MSTSAPFIVLRAHDPVRGEILNAGIVLFAPDRALVAVSPDASKLRSLHPDYAALHVDGWSQAVEEAIASYSSRLSVSQQIAMLPLLVQPFTPDREPGTAQLQGDDPRETLDELMRWQVLARKATVRASRTPKKKPTRLNLELRQWLKGAKAFSTKIEDLSHHRVVANYPIDPTADLYADMALMNGQLHVMEVMDLRGLDRLSPAVRGEAAVKGITLDEAKSQANTIAILAASDYGVAKPAIRMMSRYANDVYDLGTLAERDRFAGFVAKGLHRQDLVGQAMMIKDR